MKNKTIMKKIHPTIVLLAAMAVTSFLGYNAGFASEQTEFPYVIQPDLGSVEFAPGDRITITSIRGNREHITPGGHYWLTGSYILASADSADLSWYATSRGPSGQTPVAKEEHIRINKGSGQFQLEKTLLSDGWMHVTFYVDNHSHGGIYFGEKGFEKTILREKNWSDFSDDSLNDKSDGKSIDAPKNQSTGSASSNLRIMSYLGDPFPAPADLDEKYSPASLAAVFAILSKQQNLHIKKLAVDDSEFPFLIYGVLVDKWDWHMFEQNIHQLKGYDYSGSVVGQTDKGETYFSVNIIPNDQYPNDACRRRLMIRLQMLAYLSSR